MQHSAFGFALCCDQAPDVNCSKGLGLLARCDICNRQMGVASNRVVTLRRYWNTLFSSRKEYSAPSVNESCSPPRLHGLPVGWRQCRLGVDGISLDTLVFSPLPTMRLLYPGGMEFIASTSDFPYTHKVKFLCHYPENILHINWAWRGDRYKYDRQPSFCRFSAVSEGSDHLS